MDALTLAADAILNENLGDVFAPLKSSRAVLDNITNKQLILPSDHNCGSSLSALFHEKITALPTKAKHAFNTPGKRRKNSMKYSDENQAPSPKTPKNSKSFAKFHHSPATPLSNLKMLTRIASMEDPLPSKKNLFESSDGLCGSKLGFRRCISDNLNPTPMDQSKTKFKRHSTSSDLDACFAANDSNKTIDLVAPHFESSRREKSLGLLCERFLDHFPMEVSCLETPRRLIIDDVANVLGTERRRVYDIVNILECLNMASRVQKNMYQWMGRQHLEVTLSKLKGLAQEFGMKGLKSPIDPSLNEKMFGNSPKFVVSNSGGRTGSSSEKGDARKEKSIGILCQKFLMLFLISPPPHILHLESAIHLLLGQDGDDLEKVRNRGRRIYDIANVLVSLHLIQKLPQCRSFIYIGPNVEAYSGEVILESSRVKLRHSLLPPPLVNVVHPKGFNAKKDGPDCTPLEIKEERVDKTKKLSSQTSQCRAKRNCLVGRTKSEESKLQFSGMKLSSLQDICEVAEAEREKLLLSETDDRSNEECKSKDPNKIIPQALKTRLGKTFRFPFLASPRVALNFQNPVSPRPSKFTSQPPSTVQGVQGISKVIVRSPFVLRKFSSSKETKPSNDKPVYLIHTSSGNHSGNGSNSKSGSFTPLRDHSYGSFKIFNNQKNSNSHLRTFSLPDISTSSSPGELSKAPSQAKVTPGIAGASKTPKATSDMDAFARKQNPKLLMKKSLSQMTVPSISFNTLSKNRYKTVLGAPLPPALGARKDGSSSTSVCSNGSYHFVINPATTKMATATTSSVKSEPDGSESKSTFVKIFQNSPDNSSTDSELESIFGDAFKFTRPKKLWTKI